MHDVAENGVAAHWQYKSEDGSRGKPTDGKQYRWLRELLEILENEITLLSQSQNLQA